MEVNFSVTDTVGYFSYYSAAGEDSICCRSGTGVGALEDFLSQDNGCSSITRVPLSVVDHTGAQVNFDLFDLENKAMALFLPDPALRFKKAGGRLHILGEDGSEYFPGGAVTVHDAEIAVEVDWNLPEDQTHRQDSPAEPAGVPFDCVDTVSFSGSAFVLTGEFEHLNNDREAIKAMIQEKGGRVTGAISGKTNYLVVGSLGDYGAKKLEQAAEQQANGKDLKIIREYDLFHALRD